MTGQFHDEIGGLRQEPGALIACWHLASRARWRHTISVSGGQHFKKIETLIETLSTELTGGKQLFLVKGSRFMRMERVADAVCATQAEGKN